MAGKKDGQVAKALLKEAGRTYADEAGIKLADAPAPLYQLLVLALLSSARISTEIAVAAARELRKAGFTSPAKMAEASWQDRVDALGRGHYRRYDERTATMLGDGAELIQDRYRGDLRRLAAEAGDDPRAASRLLQEVPGIGPLGADIFLREVQAVWPWVRPYADRRITATAKDFGLPGSADGLAGAVGGKDLSRLTAALLRASRDKELAARVKG
jgi:hypothetical protein